MYVATTKVESVLLGITALVGWAAQANALVDLKVSPGIYHFDFIIWRTLFCFVLCILFGSKWCPPNDEDSWSNIIHVFQSGAKSLWTHLGGASLAGITDMLFQVFLFSGVDGAGLSNSVPMQTGTSTLFGSFLTLLVDKRANLYFFIPGVFVNLLAVFINAMAYDSLNKDNKIATSKTIPTSDIEKDVEQPKPRVRFSTTKIILICIAGAVVGIPLGPGMALAAKQPDEFNPYSVSLMMCLSGLICTPIVSYLFMRFPFQGESTNFKDWYSCTWRQRWPAIWGAFSWVLGTMAYALAAPGLGNAITYIFGQSTPFVTSLFSIFYWKEFKNAGKKTWTLEILMLCLFFSCLVLMCFAQE